jgi:kynureninase
VTDTSEAAAHERDAETGGVNAACRREEFLIPPADGGRYPQVAYFAGNSLGLQAKGVRDDVNAELSRWATDAVNGHFTGAHPWATYPDELSASMARLVGANTDEVFVMNGLTVNLHFLLVSFYRPTTSRYRIVIEDHAFPSDSYAVRSHTALHGFDPDDAVIRLQPRDGEDVLRTGDVIAALEEHGDSIATVLLGAVNYLTGELMDVDAITRIGHEIGATVGWDLAHAAGNVPMHLHDWDVDFAVWCTYKYLNGGPGSIGAAFVHERFLDDDSLPRLEGWFGNDANTQFLMAKEIDTPRSARAWAMSTPPVLALAPLRASLALFDEVGLPALRERSLALSEYLRDLLDVIVKRGAIEIVTPHDDAHRGTQISVRVKVDPVALTHTLFERHGVLPDDRRPDILRFAPVALYCTFHDCWRAADALAYELTGEGL